MPHHKTSALGTALSRRRFAQLAGAGVGAAFWGAVSARGFEERLGLRAGGQFLPVKLNPKDPENMILLNSNENPYGPSPRALEAMAEARGLAMRYPDYWADQLQEKLAAFHMMSPENVVVTCGSTELLKLAAQAFLGLSTRLVLAEPTFEAIAYYAQQTGAEIVKVPVTSDYQHNLEVMAKAAQERPGLVYVCNPNNPTGTIISSNALVKFIRQVPRESVVLVDEAYHHFADSSEYGSMLGQSKGNQHATLLFDNVVVARTFSKVYGMAGLRLGYGVAPKELMERMRPHQVMESWNLMACTAALESLDDSEWVARNRERNHSTRDWLADAMKKRARAVIPSQANFVCVHVGRPVRPVIAAFRERGISVGRFFPGLPEHIRVTLGLPEEMEKFAAALEAILAEPASRASGRPSEGFESRLYRGAAPLWARH